MLLGTMLVYSRNADCIDLLHNTLTRVKVDGSSHRAAELSDFLGKESAELTCSAVDIHD